MVLSSEQYTVEGYPLASAFPVDSNTQTGIRM